jgi:hypothetical protein
MGLAATNYINNGVVSILSPPQSLPEIDASNFVNNGTFFVTNLNATSLFQPPLPFQSWNTRNWTNSNRMVGDPGFSFDYFDTVGQTNGWSANFQNAGNVNETNSNIFGQSYVVVSATNVFNKGTLAVGGIGLLAIGGKSIDLTRGTIAATGNENNSLAGVQDLYWGTDIGQAGVPFFAGASNVSVFMPVTTIRNAFGGPYQYVTIFQSLVFNSFFTTYITTNVLPSGYTSYDMLFLRQTNPAISTEVRFSAAGGPGASKIVQWQALQTNRVNGVVTTNRLYLEDDFGFWGLPPILTQTPYPVPIYQLLAAATFSPLNYTITRAAPPGYAGDTIIKPTVLDPAILIGTNATFSTNVGYAATLTAAAFPPNPTIQGQTWSNTIGRIEVSAQGPKSSLNLTRTISDGQTYMLLSATNHFVGSTNATIISPVSDVYLGSTNGLMAISNLTTPFVPRMQGTIQVWSGRWTNNAPDGTPTAYSVTVVDSALAEKVPSQIQNLSLRSTNLLIGDALNVFGSLLLDTARLTISTNGPAAPTPNGELNLTSGDLLWSASLPTLQYLTNYGKISSANSIFFGGARNPPWYSGTFTEPYQTFLTHGYLLSQGNSTWANYFEFSGTNNSGVGPITVQATSAIMTNGTFLAPDADITITSGSLLISNQVLQAGRSITLTITNYLDDGSVSNSVDVITNRNIWTVSGGINLLRLPPKASLLGTTVTNTAFANAEVDDHWAGKDYGVTPRGYVTNAGLGRLILDEQDSGSLITFLRTDQTNALYLDLLELNGAATNNDAAGNFAGVYIETNFTVYYGDAVVAGRSIAEKLNGKYGVSGTNGGRFLWVSNFNTGFFSSTNIVYTDGTTNRLNRALATSCDIDSNSNGIPNCMDPNPIPIPPPMMLVLSATVTNHPSPMILVSWDTLPGSSNYLFAASSPMALRTNWQLVTNFISLTGGRVTVADPVKTNRSRYYRVNALSP